MSTLYIVATPIGNLSDISLRALDVLRSVYLILCEDTRVTKKLLDRYQIVVPTISYHQHSQIKKIEYILNLLKSGKDLALVSDAGTPGVSDPGNKLINLIIKELNNVTIVPLPGPSAITAAASISGFPMDRFFFAGFPPAKRKRNKFFEKIAKSEYPVIFYESPHRILKTLQELDTITKNHKLKIQLTVCRELTKKFEIIYRGKIEDILNKIKLSRIRGEFVVVADNLN
ncbi:MAG: 16S rRNA (cytidine(1402)-2'-O)-methyltransferase [Candidatus Nealsonbacteria bacterium]|nr:16S rRNA (cytidine(1402)-2'-O)-methyltransferase [Candidatus Nealsonbacteria bacterium]